MLEGEQPEVGEYVRHVHARLGHRRVVPIEHSEPPVFDEQLVVVEVAMNRPKPPVGEPGVLLEERLWAAQRTCTYYCMCMFERRLQILIDEARYRRLLQASRQRQQSVSAVIREAIDRALPSDVAKRRAAANAILAAEPMPVPETVEELKAELDEIRSGGL